MAFAHARPMNESVFEVLDALPAHLLRLGRSVYGSSLTAVVARAREPVGIASSSLPTNAARILLVEPPGDRSIQNIHEAERAHGDLYGLKRLRDNHEDDQLLIDLGANLGFFTIVMSILLPRAQVLAIEPSPMLFFWLQWNLHLNNVTVLDAGAFHGRARGGGVHALNRVATDVDNATVRFIYSHNETQLGVAMPVTGAGGQQSGDYEEFFWARRKLPSYIRDARASWVSADVGSVDVRAYLQRARRQGAAVRFLKFDCEACEYAVLPALADAGWLAAAPAAGRVEFLGGELHRDMLPAGYNLTRLNALQATLRARGCRLRELTTIVRC